MKNVKSSKKLWVNLIIALTGIGIVMLYNICEESCTYLQGSILGIELKYLGLFYMGMLIAFNLLRRELVFLSLISFGVGAEIYLIGFQIVSGVYCYYCLAFGAVIILLFLLNLNMSKKSVISIFIIVGFILFSFVFKGAVTPAYADEILLPSFGKGKIEVRLYTDYFCGPCSSLEPKLEPILKDLVKRNIINITFIDTPVHSQTMLYTRYFLYSVNEEKEFKYVLRVRTALFEAAKNKIIEKEKLEEFLKNKGIKFKQFDVVPTFGVFDSYFKEDKINATPLCVIKKGDKKESFKGVAEIMKALDNLKR